MDCLRIYQEPDHTGQTQCEDCGQWFPSEEMAPTECPYAYEINNRVEMCVICEHCYGQRAADI
jgi:hypothetical protein